GGEGGGAGVLDRFTEGARWQAMGSDGVQASIQPAEGLGGRALRLDFDFGRAAGYAIARRAVPVDLPASYEISFYLRADAPVNDFQLKLIDSSGDNVWWFQRRNFQFPHDWQLVTIKTRQIQFAWGPTPDRVLRHAAAIELVVSAGRGGGGRGSVYFSELLIREVSPPPTVLPPPSVKASSQLAGA